MTGKFLLFCLIVCSLGERSYLKEGRQIHWKSENANHGPYFGQPEQVHLAYDGQFLYVFIKNLLFRISEPFEYYLGNVRRHRNLLCSIRTKWTTEATR